MSDVPEVDRDNITAAKFSLLLILKIFMRQSIRWLKLDSGQKYTLQEMCCGFLLSREMWYRKSVLPGTGAG